MNINIELLKNIAITAGNEILNIYITFICSNSTGIKHQIRVATWESHKLILVDPFADFVEACWSDIGESID